MLITELSDIVDIRYTDLDLSFKSPQADWERMLNYLYIEEFHCYLNLLLKFSWIYLKQEERNLYTNSNPKTARRYILKTI